MALLGQNVLVVDLDPQANATSCLGVDKLGVSGGTYGCWLGGSAAPFVLLNERLKLSLLPSSPSLAGAEVELVEELARETLLKKALAPLLDRYDYILIDCPPSLGLLTVNGLVAAKDGVVVPVQCEYLALEGLGQLTQTIQRVRSALFPAPHVHAVFLTMFDVRTKLSSDVVAEVNRHFPGQVFKSVVPRSARLPPPPPYEPPTSPHPPPPARAQASH